VSPMQQPAHKASIQPRYVVAWIAVFLAISLYLQGWPGSSIDRWAGVVIGSLVGGGMFAWLHARSGFRIK